ncbi:MAG: YgiQ family radical SAM protein [Candidatus Woesearchaeota archaeon]|nr:MAG: YgiQ family radical SAM protein [Candidatus Woesearchaeota archaeon]
MQYDVVFVIGELFFDHPLSGVGLLKRLLEKYGYSVGVIEQPTSAKDVTKLGAPKLFFGVSSGAIDSMVRNYTPLKKRRDEDEFAEYDEKVMDRALIVYCNWLKEHFKGVPLVLGGTEATLRRFAHYDYWQNKLRKPILVDTRADIMVYGNGEKPILEIAQRIKEGKDLFDIKGTCILTKELPDAATVLPSYEEVVASKEAFVDLQNGLTNIKTLAQKVDTRYVIQYVSPKYTSQDLDEYYELPFTRKVPKTLRGFEFSVVTHRGCLGECSFCALPLIQGDKIVSRSEESIIREITAMTTLPHFKGNVDDLGGPSANMYGMDCGKCTRACLQGCSVLDRSNKRLISLLRKLRAIKGVKHIYIRSGIRYDLASEEYVKELVAGGHIYDTLRIAPEHVNKNVLQLMQKDEGNLQNFINFFESLNTNKELSYYFITAHPGSTMKEAKELHQAMKGLKNAHDVQVFIPTPMTDSTCMYYTGMDLKKNKIHVPYTYKEKKEQKRVLYEA